jgi:hypothetical protein
MSEDKTSTQSEAAQRALKMKNEAAESEHPPAGKTADEGMTPTPNSTIAPSGALDAEGHRPVVERSRKAR